MSSEACGRLNYANNLQLVGEFYANVEDRVDDEVFVRGVWMMLASEAINKLVDTLEHEEDDYSLLMEEGMDAKELEKKLCQNTRKWSSLWGETINPPASMLGHCYLVGHHSSS